MVQLASGDRLSLSQGFWGKTSVRKYYALAGGMIQGRVQLGSFVKKGDRVDRILSFRNIM